MFLILQKKILDSILDLKFVVFFLLATVLLLVSTISGYTNYAERLDAFEQNSGKLREVMEMRGSYLLLKTEGVTLRRPPEPLSVFFRGVSSSVGENAPINNAANVSVIESRNGRQPLFAALGNIDFGFIFQFVFSLFAFVMAYDAISGERENGTLKQLLANPVRRTRFLLATAFGGLAVLWLAVLLPVLLCVLLVVTILPVNFGLSGWLLFSGAIGANLLFLAVIYLTGLLISSLNRSSFSSFLNCLAVWIIIVGIIPVFAMELAARVSTAPSIDELEAEIAALKRDNAIFLKDLLFEKMDSALAADPLDNEGRQAAQAEAYSIAQDRFLRAEEELHRSYMRKQMALARTARLMGRVSPATTINIASSSLAGTDEEIMTRFLEDARRFRHAYLRFADKESEKDWTKTLSGSGRNLMIDANDETGVLEDYSITWLAPSERIDVSGAPRVTYSSPDVASRFSKALPDIALLSLEALVMLLLAVLAFTRYDVR